MGNKPFIHMFQTPRGCYLFDVNTNQVINVSPHMYNYLAKVEASDTMPELSPDISRELDDMKLRRLLSSKRPTIMKHESDERLEHHLESGIEQVTLQLTQACNFRCSYCAYAVPDFAVQRQHAFKRMEYETAVKAINFYQEHSSGQKQVVIGFYGGEPLLEYELIRKTVMLAEEVFEGKQLKFTITTNGSLFTKENLDFLSNHNFDVIVSIDGAEEIHDRSRKFAANGKGTFATIEKNLRYIKSDYPSLYRRLSINSVIDPRYSVEALHDLFDNDDLYKEISTRSGIIDDAFSVEKVVLSEKYKIETGIHEFKCYMSIMKRYPKDKVSKTIFNEVVSRHLKQEPNMRRRNTLPDTMSHSGPCIPGKRRLFINVDGDFYPCEKVNENSSVMKIGSINNGFDVERARSILNVVELTADECRNCWAIAHCISCARHCDDNGTLSRELKLSKCNDIRYSVELGLKDYALLKEHGIHIKG